MNPIRDAAGNSGPPDRAGPVHTDRVFAPCARKRHVALPSHSVETMVIGVDLAGGVEPGKRGARGATGDPVAFQDHDIATPAGELITREKADQAGTDNDGFRSCIFRCFWQFFGHAENDYAAQAKSAELSLVASADG